MLTIGSYDGEADDPAPAVKDEPVKAEPEPEPVQAEPQEDSYQADDTDDFNIQTEPEYGTEGMQGMQDAHINQQVHGDDYDRPIGSKEDGYVPSFSLSLSFAPCDIWTKSAGTRELQQYG